MLVGSLSYSEDSRAASIYDPAYTAPGYSCRGTRPACCSRARIPDLIHEMFSGTGLYTGQNDLQQYYYINTLWPLIERGLQQTADEMRNAVMFYVGAVGAMIDGQNMNQALLALQKQTTNSLQTETVSDQICRFGTMSRSLANSEDKALAVQLGLSAEIQNRQLMTKNMNAGIAGPNREIGRSADKLTRFEQFKTKFCDATDSDAGLRDVCTTASDVQHNRDIDMARTLDIPLTLDIDFSGLSAAAKPTIDEQNVFALSSNLYANNLGVNIGKSDFQIMASEGSTASDSRVEKLLDFRSAIAKRSVAANTFAAFAGMKAAGPEGSVGYMKEILKELGLTTADDLTAMIGDNPSYYAQMDILARKLYQSPKFYANLMESPTNVERQQTAIEGVELMQDRDIYESLQRSEMLLSSLLEIYVLREQDGFKDKGVK